MADSNKETPAGLEDFSHLLKYSVLLLSRVFGFLKRVFRKKIILITGLTIFGLVLGYLKQYISKPVYQVSMQVTQNELPKKSFADKLQVLNDLISTHSYHSVAGKLKISSDLAREIKTIEAENIFGLPLQKDTSNKGAFFIRVELTDNQHLDSLQNGLLEYLNDFEYINRTKKVKRAILEAKDQFLTKQLNQLDSFKVNYSHFLSQTGSGSINLMANKNDVSDLFIESNSMMGEKQYIADQLQLHDKILYLLDGFSTPENPKKGTIVSSIIIFALIGFGLGYIIGIFQVLNSEIKF